MEDIPSDKPHHQCYRLFYCIQAAVAKTAGSDEIKKQWAAQRVQLLLELIPQKPRFPLGIYIFVCVGHE